MLRRLYPRVSRDVLRSAVPAIAEWDTYGHAVLNLLIFGLVALAAEWIVHQIEYLVEYGNRFGTVMVTTPHRFYMEPAGLTLAVGIAALLTGAAALVRWTTIRRQSLLHLLRGRLHHLVPNEELPGSLRSIYGTALALAMAQVGLYLLQENIERAAIGAGWPGLSVLLASRHATVLPLHLLAALCGSFLIWALWARLRHSRRVSRFVEMLVRLLVPRGDAPVHLVPGRVYLPNQRLRAGSLGLRSPPLAAA